MKEVTEMSFEEALRELEQVVDQLERGDVELEKSIALYERGALAQAFAYVAANVVLAIAALFFGMWLAKNLT